MRIFTNKQLNEVIDSMEYDLKSSVDLFLKSYCPVDESFESFTIRNSTQEHFYSHIDDFVQMLKDNPKLDRNTQPLSLISNSCGLFIHFFAFISPKDGNIKSFSEVNILDGGISEKDLLNYCETKQSLFLGKFNLKRFFKTQFNLN